MEDVYPSNETTAWGLILLAQTSNSDHRSLDKKTFLLFYPTLEHLELAIHRWRDFVDKANFTR